MKAISNGILSSLLLACLITPTTASATPTEAEPNKVRLSIRNAAGFNIRVHFPKDSDGNHCGEDCQNESKNHMKANSIRKGYFFRCKIKKDKKCLIKIEPLCASGKKHWIRRKINTSEYSIKTKYATTKYSQKEQFKECSGRVKGTCGSFGTYKFNDENNISCIRQR